jgi:hypothetical protein
MENSIRIRNDNSDNLSKIARNWPVSLNRDKGTKIKQLQTQAVPEYRELQFLHQGDFDNSLNEQFDKGENDEI